MLHIFMCCTPFSINGIKVFAWLFTAHTHSHSHRVFSFFVSIVCLFARTFLNGHEINLFSERICAVDILYCELLPYKSYSLYVVMTIVCLSKWFVQQISFFLFLLLLQNFFDHTLDSLPILFCPVLDGGGGGIFSLEYTAKRISFYICELIRKYGCWLKIDQSFLELRVQATESKHYNSCHKVFCAANVAQKMSEKCLAGCEWVCVR